MFRLIIFRLIQLPLILVIILLITFYLAWMVPGSPIDNNPDKPRDAASAELLEAKYNLDSRTSFLVSYVKKLRRPRGLKAQCERTGFHAISLEPRRLVDFSRHYSILHWAPPPGRF